ncbi:MAG: CinA family protein [Alphaproteobacteria bacterium]
MFDDAIRDQARAVLDACRAQGLMLVVAESCTGGLVAGALTEIAGASDVVERGFVTYSYESKTAMLGVPAETIAGHGAVSEEVARAMAEGALALSRAQIAIAVTGVAGPGSDSQAKPAGLVHLAAARDGKDTLHEKREFGDAGRDAVRRASVEAALDLVLKLLQRA